MNWMDAACQSCRQNIDLTSQIITETKGNIADDAGTAHT